MTTETELPNILAVFDKERVFSSSQALKNTTEAERKKASRAFGESSKQRAEREFLEGKEMLARSLPSWPSTNTWRSMPREGGDGDDLSLSATSGDLRMAMSNYHPRLGSAKSTRKFTAVGALKQPGCHMGASFRHPPLESSQSLPSLAEVIGQFDPGERYENKYVSRLMDRRPNGGFFCGSTLAALKITSGG
eukprot:TRINITY_DN97727_c0_g1_i1.p1 TRINITY_DN97727_c0_g1~~TRINITY_DN97727_c0_g1_i1.p1  ORF type:complete len:224 (-),score=33.71 TRINITY_DN97727_c0_g1_i1:78-653(-)